MDEELKKYVQAYIDGEEVEYKDLGREWETVTGLCTFEYPEFNFRLKPKGKVKMWQWVIKDSKTKSLYTTTRFFTEKEAKKFYENDAELYTLVKKAKWTEIEVEE